MYSLDCDYFDRVFETLPALIDYINMSGMDPNYEITRAGQPTGEMAIDLLGAY